MKHYRGNNFLKRRSTPGKISVEQKLQNVPYHQQQKSISKHIHTAKATQFLAAWVNWPMGMYTGHKEYNKQGQGKNRVGRTEMKKEIVKLENIVYKAHLPF